MFSGCVRNLANCSCPQDIYGNYLCPSALDQSCVSTYASCVTTPAVVWSIGWLLLAAAWIPLFYFCRWPSAVACRTV
jgi:hypothetical protein